LHARQKASIFRTSSGLNGEPDTVARAFPNALMDPSVERTGGGVCPGVRFGGVTV